MIHEVSKIKEVSKQMNNNSFDPDKRIESNQTLEKKKCETYDPDKRIDYYTPLKKRIDLTPKENSPHGYWAGERGKSPFSPDTDTDDSRKARKCLEKFGQKDISFKDGYPDFSKVTYESVEIENMTDKIFENFKQADTACAKKWNEQLKDGRSDWKLSDVKKFRTDNNLTWHEHQNLKTCQLVDRSIHKVCRHAGGRMEYKARHHIKEGGFDE